MDKFVGIVVALVALVIVMSLVMALPTMLLWNYLMPTIFGLKTIGFWQALWLNVLCGILFKNTSVSKSN